MANPRYATLACGLFQPEINQGFKDSGRRFEIPLYCLKEFKIEGLFQEVAITIDDYQKVCTQRHKEESAAAAAAKSLQSCPTLCDHIDRSPLGSAVPGILQARILEWVAIPFSNA